MRNPNDGEPPIQLDRPKKPTLPPARTFIVSRRNPSVPADCPVSSDRVEKITVSAHSVDMTPDGALMFIEFRLIDGDLVPQLPRVFNGREWLDYEEVLVSKSRLIH